MKHVFCVALVLSIGACSQRSTVAPSSESAAIVSAAAQPSELDRFAKTFAKAVRQAFGDPETAGVFAMATKTTIATVPMQLRAAGTITAPLPQANQISVPLDATLAQFTLNILAADKAATGLTLRWSFEFSSDGVNGWTETNAATWLSYGPAGYTNRDGVLNPDPSLDVPLTQRRGQFIRMVLRTDQPMTIGLAVNVT